MGKKGKGSKVEGNEGNYLCITPDSGFSIKKAAKDLAQMMEDSGLPLILKMPNNIEIEFECGCTPKEILEGYNNVLHHHIVVKSTSNKNDK